MRVTNYKKRKKRNPILSCLATIIGIIGVVLAAILGALGGGLLEATPAPPTAVDFPTTGAPSGNVSPVAIRQGYGAQKDFWQVYFTGPTGSREEATYFGGVDEPLAQAINGVRATLDIAAYEWNSPVLTRAVIDAHQRGVNVRMVVDDEGSIEDEDSTINDVIRAGVEVIDDERGGLMHNKFMILDGQVVWTGSLNYTINDLYRNNNNVLVLRSRRAVEAYQAEFSEMFQQREFGSSRSVNNSVYFNQDGTDVLIMFAPEDNVVPNLLDVINNAQHSVYFMTFSFTLDEVGDALLQKAQQGIEVAGIFETRGSRTDSSQLPPLLCAGLEIREDGNPFTFHHKVFIIDEEIVATGSFNISSNATNSNDENMLIIQDADLAAQYIAEMERVWAQAVVPPRNQISC